MPRLTTDIWAIDRGCDKCDRTGWVCENHPEQPWDGTSCRADACHCGGAGVPCACNPLAKDVEKLIMDAAGQ